MYCFKYDNDKTGYFTFEEKETDLICHEFYGKNQITYYSPKSWDLEATSESAMFKAFNTGDRIKDTITFSIQPTPNIKNISYNANPGFFKPRLYRGELGMPYINTGNSELIDEVRNYKLLCNEVFSLFQTIEPNKHNFKSHGNKIRQLLILSSTEVEYLFRMFLKANSYPSKPDEKRWNTVDYFHCKKAMKLDEFTVALSGFPKCDTFSPFMGWLEESPTQSLDFYDSYNKVKHNRGENSFNASLENLLNSIAAIHILLEAQYGPIFDTITFPDVTPPLFMTTHKPNWHSSEICCPELSDYGINWKGTINYEFN